MFVAFLAMCSIVLAKRRVVAGMGVGQLLMPACVLAAAIASLIVAVIVLSKSGDQVTNTAAGTSQPTNPVPIYAPVFPNAPLTGYINDPAWWKKNVVYQVYPRSFQDSDADGTGDLRGIINRLDYFVWLGVKVLWLNPIYTSPMADFGYDVSNFTDIDPLFGTMDDFHDLVKGMHDRGMYLIMDYVPNHCSNQHIWFQKASRGDAHFRNYFIWRNGRNQTYPPNNWNSCFGNSSWELNGNLNKYYLHQYLMEQPDLNYRNANVSADMVDVLKFWMNKHVDGFRIDAIVHLYEDAAFPDEPTVPKCANNSNCAISPNDYDYQIHKYNIDQPETYVEVSKWAQLMKQFGLDNNKTIFSCTEAGTSINNVMKYYQNGMSFSFNFFLQDYFKHNSQYNSTGLKHTIDNWMSYLPQGGWPNWVLGNHDNHRIASQLGYTDIANMLLLLLPGTPTSYYGDEIGMKDVFVTFAQTQDPAGKKWGPAAYQNHSRDPERTGMQWNLGFNAGFSASVTGTWLPMSPTSSQVNVQLQMNEPRSHLNIYRSLVQLRYLPMFWTSGTNLLTWAPSDDLFVFARTSTLHTSPTTNFLILLNLGRTGRTSSTTLAQFLPNTMSGLVKVTSANLPPTTLAVGQIIPAGFEISLQNGQGVVIETSKNFR